MGVLDASKPRALSIADIQKVIVDFEQAAVSARLAGFDGVEIPGANGYLFERFLNPHANTRNDAYGCSRENRCRLLLEVVDQVVEKVGAMRAGERLSPFNIVFDMPACEDNDETYRYLAKVLNKRNIALIHLNDEGTPDLVPLLKDYLPKFRGINEGTLLLANSLTHADAERLVSAS
ncbi:hypothetical protein KXR63_15095 [Stutzerimonas chloritidismutans]|uniref:oxidoreductase n=1 Tax=Stutzerimonas chloritidismutans TaxID=203192 RepID=UPI003F15EE63